MQLEAEALGFQRAFPDIGPANVKGLEINPYAAELARVAVCGEIQWMRRNGFYESRDPILKPSTPSNAATQSWHRTVPSRPDPCRTAVIAF